MKPSVLGHGYKMHLKLLLLLLHLFLCWCKMHTLLLHTHFIYMATKCTSYFTNIAHFMQECISFCWCRKCKYLHIKYKCIFVGWCSMAKIVCTDTVCGCTFFSLSRHGWLRWDLRFRRFFFPPLEQN